MAGILYLQAVRARPEAYRTGFSNAEKQFLFDAGDAADSYFSDFVILVCTENSVHVDYVTESPNVNGDDRSVLPLPGFVRLAVQVEEPT